MSLWLLVDSAGSVPTERRHHDQAHSLSVVGRNNLGVVGRYGIGGLATIALLLPRKRNDGSGGRVACTCCHADSDAPS